MQINGSLLFFLCLAFLIAGYFVYGGIIERIVRPKKSRVTPAIAKHDGIDYMVLPRWKIFFIQLLNIAGLGPVYGAILGALFGPIALLWITFGCIFFGAVHDYFSGVISMRHGGASLPEVIGRYLGKNAMVSIRILCISLIVLVGVVFALGPAGLLAKFTSLGSLWWVAIIFIYYFAATVLPLDQIIGRIYPLFAVCLVLMAGGMLYALVFSDLPIIPDCTIAFDMHPAGIPIWPMMFVTIACGAISGFHATQSPLMARCIKCESHARPMFFGAMVVEGIIALIWCAVGLTFYQNPENLSAAICGKDAGIAVFESSTAMLGEFGRYLALLGVIVLPITSGDTALRSARLMIADSFNISQRPIAKRLAIAIPLLLVCLVIAQLDFDVIWRYFGWLNQCIACLTLLCISVFLLKTGRPHWISTIPGVILSAVCITYGLVDKNCLNLPLLPSSIGAGIASLLLILWVYSKRRR